MRPRIVRSGEIDWPTPPEVPELLDVVRVEEGEPIAGTAVRCIVGSDRTGGRFCVLTGELGPRSLVVPHTHAGEDELSFVQQGRIGARVGDHDVTVEAGGFLFRPRGVLHALWNPTDQPAVTVEFICPGGLERFFEELGRLRLSRGLSHAGLVALANRYDSPFQPELIAELAHTYGVRPLPPWTAGDRAS
jgi:mannose-6-phosphate isomerase-like protein (cupin superfamily)